MGDEHIDIDAALKDHPADVVAAELAKLHNVDRDAYLKDGRTDEQFLNEMRGIALPKTEQTAEAKPTEESNLSGPSNAANALLGGISATGLGAANYASNKLKGAALAIAGSKGVPSMDTSAPSRTFASPVEVSQRVSESLQPAKPFATPQEVEQRVVQSALPKAQQGPGAVVNWTVGKTPETAQYERGYMGGTDYGHESELQKAANELERKNPGYKVAPGTRNTLIPHSEYMKMKEAEKAAMEAMGDKAKMAAEVRANRLKQAEELRRQEAVKAAELRANRLAQINSSNIPAKIATNISNAPMAKRFMTGYNVGDLLQAQNPFEATVSTMGAAAPYGAGMVEKVLPQKYKGLAKLLGPVVSTAAPAINYLERKIIGPQEEPQQAAGGPVQGYAGGKAVKGALDFLAEKVAPTVKRAIGEFDPRFDPRVKEQPKLQNMILHEQNVGPKEISKIDLSKYEGHPFITGMSDRTAAGKNLMGVNDVMFNRPVALKGGQDFMFNSPHLWASAPSVTKQMMEHASALRDFTGRDPLFIPWQMAPTGSDYAHMTGQSMLAHAEAAMGKRDKNLLDKHMRQFIPEWKGIDHPESLEQFASASGPVRKAIQNTLDTNFRDRGALGIGEARLAITDPRQLNTPEGSIFNVGMFNPDAPRSFTSGHQSYPTAVPGQGLGQVDRNINIFQALPKVVQERGIIDPTKPGQTDLRALQMKPYGGILSEDVLRGMGYADGGEVQGYAGGKAVTGALEYIGKKILPAAEREANKAKYLENSVVKTPMYHGTSSDITEFKPKTAGTIFVTSNPRFAESFGDAHQKQMVKNIKDRMSDKEFMDIMRGGGYENLDNVVNLGLPARQNIMPVHVNATNPFDYENPQHVEALFNELSKADGAPSTHSISHGAWDLLELPHVQAGIKNLGHDSYFVQEGGQKNLGLYQPTQLKSAIGNEGTFNPLDPDIAKKEGGEIEGYAGGKAVRHAISQIPEVAQALEAYLRGQITNAERLDILNKHLPIRKWNELPPNYTDDQIRAALKSDKQAKALADVPAGMQVGNRLDIPAYTQHGVYVDTVHNAKGSPISYNRTGHLQDVQFSSRPNQAVRVGLGTKAQALTPMGAEIGSEKSPFALMKGTNIGTSDDEVRRMMQEYLNDPNWTQIGMDPRRNSQFYDKSTGLPVFSATEKLQSGPLVMVPKGGLESSHWEDPRLLLSDFEGKHYAGGGHATPAWQRSEGKNPEGGLNAAGRASYNREHGAHLKAPQPEGGSRKDSFCARMTGMREKLTSSETAHDPDSRINKALRKWKC